MTFPLDSWIWKDRGSRTRDSLYPAFRGPQRADVTTPCSSKLQAPWRIAPGTCSHTNKQLESELKLRKPESRAPPRNGGREFTGRRGPADLRSCMWQWSGQGRKGMGAVFVSTCVYVGGHCGAVCVFIVEICASYCQVGLSVGVTGATQVWLGKGLAPWCDGAVGAQAVISTLPTRGQLGKRWPWVASVNLSTSQPVSPEGLLFKDFKALSFSAVPRTPAPSFPCPHHLLLL